MQQQQTLAELSKSRFKDLPWFSEIERINKNERVEGIRPLIIGAGGIGSWLTMFLTRAGLDVEVYDMDTIEEHNLGGQLYMTGQIGMNKAEAAAMLVQIMSGKDIGYSSGTFVPGWDVSSFTFSCVDNMKTRNSIFNAWLSKVDYVKTHGGITPKFNPIFVDGRLLAEDGQVFAVRATDKEAIRLYQEKYLFSDAEVAPIVCTAKATSHCGAQVAILMASTFFNHLTNMKLEGDIREVPFKQEFHLQLLQFEQEDAIIELQPTATDGQDNTPLAVTTDLESEDANTSQVQDDSRELSALMGYLRTI